MIHPNHSSSGYSTWSEAARARWEDFWSSRGAIEKVLLVLEDNNSRDCIPWGSAEEFLRPELRRPRKLVIRRSRKATIVTAPPTVGPADGARHRRPRPRADLAPASVPDGRGTPVLVTSLPPSGCDSH